VAEPALAAQVGQRAVGRGDHPAGEALALAAAERRERALLQHLEQLDLDRDRSLADLVEKERPVRAAALEDALVMVDRAGERALAMSEQLRLDQRLGELRQVDRDEAVGVARREAALVEGIGNERRAPDRGRR